VIALQQHCLSLGVKRAPKSYQSLLGQIEALHSEIASAKVLFAETKNKLQCKIDKLEKQRVKLKEKVAEQQKSKRLAYVACVLQK